VFNTHSAGAPWVCVATRQLAFVALAHTVCSCKCVGENGTQQGGGPWNLHGCIRLLLFEIGEVNSPSTPLQQPHIRAAVTT
jgi:hypothetical protein